PGCRAVTLVAWYRSAYAPRTGGAYDSHHRTAGIAGRTRRRGGGVAARGARAAVGNARDRISAQRITGVHPPPVERLPSRAWRIRLRRRAERRAILFVAKWL